MTKLYYTAPSDEAFADMKQACIALWGTFDDTFKYSSGKIAQIKDVENVKDNFMYFFAMFDQFNQRKLSRNYLKVSTVEEVRKRMIDGGCSEHEVAFALGDGEEDQDAEEVDDGGNDFGHDDIAQDNA